MGSLAEVLEFDAHQLTITVPNTEWWLGTLNAEQVKSTIYIYLKKRVGCQQHLRQSGFLFLCCQQFNSQRVRDVFQLFFTHLKQSSHTMKLYQSNYSLHSYRKYFKHNHRHLCTWQHFGFSGRTPFPTEKIKLLWTIKTKEYQNKKMKYKLNINCF